MTIPAKITTLFPFAETIECIKAAHFQRGWYKRDEGWDLTPEGLQALAEEGFGWLHLLITDDNGYARQMTCSMADLLGRDEA